MDTYSDQGGQVSKPETPKGAQIVDLMGALRASLGVRQDAPKAEAPPVPKRVNHKWRYESTDGVKDSVVSTCTVCGLRLDGWPGTHRNPGCKPAPPAPKCDHARIDPSQPCDVCPPAPVSVECGCECTESCDHSNHSHPHPSCPLAAPVSEPPIDWKRVLKFANEYEDDWTPGDLPNASRAILSLIAECDALKAKTATLTAEVERLKALPNRQTILRQAAELERLRDLIVAHGEAGGEGEDFVQTCVDIDNEARAIQAREAGKA